MTRKWNIMMMEEVLDQEWCGVYPMNPLAKRGVLLRNKQDTANVIIETVHVKVLGSFKIWTRLSADSVSINTIKSI